MLPVTIVRPVKSKGKKLEIRHIKFVMGLEKKRYASHFSVMKTFAFRNLPVHGMQYFSIREKLGGDEKPEAGKQKRDVPTEARPR